MNWKKLLLFAGIGLVLLLVLGGVALNWMMKQPLYKFGHAKAEKGLRGPLTPPAQDKAGKWRVEKDIYLTWQGIGKGAPALVIHGGPGYPYTRPWKALEPLKDKYRFYFYHQRGCGTSSRPITKFASKNVFANTKTLDRTYGLSAQVADIERIRRILKVKQLILIGHSYGGFLASLYAAEFPKRVKKLVLIAPADLLTPPDEKRSLFSKARKKMSAKTRAAYEQFMKEYFDFSGLFTKTDAQLSELQSRLGKFLLPVMGHSTAKNNVFSRAGGWMVYGLFISAGRSYDLRPVMKKIQAPTLVLHGKDDEYQGSLSYKNSIPGARFVTVGRDRPKQPAGHFLHKDSPRKFVAAIKVFLQK
jgi:proline iminopeptidase